MEIRVTGRRAGSICWLPPKRVSWLISASLTHRLSILTTIANGSGAVTAMLTNPIWVVKTRVFATAKNDPKAFRGLWGE